MIIELAVRSPTKLAGRPATVFIPTFAAFALVGEEPPNGRGSAVHRHIQHLVVAGATAKGYRSAVEYPLKNGSIVDVHLEKDGKDGVRVAVEIAVNSRPELEIAHIKHCLTAGYDQVFGIFVDERLLERTQVALSQAVSQEERGKVRLLPVSRLSLLG